jgi:malyl-CoA/(S)-citramalyl-CoA lyase
VSTRENVVRSYLAVPAHRERFVQSASASNADAVFLDLEDAVPVAEKQSALAASIYAMRNIEWGRKRVAVRVNAIGSPTIEEEIEQLARCDRLDAIIIPKAERPSEIAQIGDVFTKLARPEKRPIALELLIETALGITNVDDLAFAHCQVQALHFGVGDFTASIGARSMTVGMSPGGYQNVSVDQVIELTPIDLFSYPMMRILVAARSRGLRAVDGPYGDCSNLDASYLSARKAASMGYDSKQVIHPSQIGPTHEAFRPTEDELAQANRIVAAMEEAERRGLGATTVGGKMIDAVNVKMALRVLAYGQH